MAEAAASRNSAAPSAYQATGRPHHPGNVEQQRVQRHGIHEVFTPGHVHDEGQPCGQIERLHQAASRGHQQQLPGRNHLGESQTRQEQRQDQEGALRQKNE